MNILMKHMHLNLNPIWCQTHTQYVITHMCLSRSCFKPLCAKCIKEHINLHRTANTHPEIEAMELLHEECLEKIRMAVQNYNGERSKLEQLFGGLNLSGEEGIKQIRKAKMIVLGLVEKFFSEFEENYLSVISEKSQDQSPLIQEYLAKIEKIIKKLNNLNDDLESKDPFPAVQHVVQQDFEEEFLRFLKELDRDLGSIKHSPYSVKVDESALGNMQRELARFIDIRATPIDYNKIREPSQKVKSVVDPNLMGQFLQNSNQNQKMRAQNILSQAYSPQHISTPSQPLSKSPNMQSHQGDLVVKTKDFFDPKVNKKYLHFFQQKSNILHLLDLELIKSTGKCEFQRIELNIDFQIPRWHRSIITPFNEIYLTGGVDRDEVETKLKEAYIYDFSKQKLVPLSSMLLGRSGHSMVYMNGHIFVVGGFSEEQEFSERCEKYSISQNTWTPIASMNIRSNNPGVCTFRNKYIYKFGGKKNEFELSNGVERYDPMYNRWIVIEFELPRGFKNFNILSSLACVEINQNQILVFGGTHADLSLKSNECWVLNVVDQETDNKVSQMNDFNQSYQVSGIDSIYLPIAEGFWNNQAIIDNQKLICLQNIPNQKDESSVCLDRRRVLIFDSINGWKILL